MKFPFYKQLDAMDCGPSCLKMIAQYYGKKFSIEELRNSCYIKKTGVTQAIVDNGIGYKDMNVIHLILIAQMALIISRSLIEMIRRWILLQVGTRINISLITDFIIKLVRLPMSFFDSKLIGDLIRRIEDHKKIEAFLTTSVLNIAFSLLTVSIFSIVLAIMRVIVVK